MAGAMDQAEKLNEWYREIRRFFSLVFREAHRKDIFGTICKLN
jgi:hypothetical protein